MCFCSFKKKEQLLNKFLLSPFILSFLKKNLYFFVFFILLLVVLQYHCCVSWRWRWKTMHLHTKLQGNKLPFFSFFFPFPQSLLHYIKLFEKYVFFIILPAAGHIFSLSTELTSKLNQIFLLVSESVPLIVQIWVLFKLNLLLSLTAMLICCNIPSWFFLVLSISLNL